MNEEQILSFHKYFIHKTLVMNFKNIWICGIHRMNL